MGYVYYENLVFISESSDFSLLILKEKLDTFYKTDDRKINTTIVEDTINVKIDNYEFYIGLNEESYVADEIREIVEDCAKDRDDKDVLLTCKKRLEISGGDEDFDMDYFNDSLYINEKIQEFKNVFIYNPQENKFDDEI